MVKWQFLRFLKLLKIVLALQFITLQTVVTEQIAVSICRLCSGAFFFRDFLPEKRKMACFTQLFINDNTESKKLNENDYIILFIFRNFMQSWIYSWYQFYLSHLFCGWFLAVTFSIPPHHLLGLQLSLWIFCLFLSKKHLFLL